MIFRNTPYLYEYHFLIITSSVAFRISPPSIFSLIHVTSTLSSSNTPGTLSGLASIVLMFIGITFSRNQGDIIHCSIVNDSIDYLRTILLFTRTDTSHKESKNEEIN